MKASHFQRLQTVRWVRSDIGLLSGQGHILVSGTILGSRLESGFWGSFPLQTLFYVFLKHFVAFLTIQVIPLTYQISSRFFTYHSMQEGSLYLVSIFTLLILLTSYNLQRVYCPVSTTDTHLRTSRNVLSHPSPLICAREGRNRTFYHLLDQERLCVHCYSLHISRHIHTFTTAPGLEWYSLYLMRLS